jgi:purine-binding chemotaxis protein CheW
MEGKKDAKPYFAFRLAGAVYAVEADKVLGVYDFSAATTIPRPLDFMRGVITVAGAAVPVVDLMLKLKLQGPARKSDLKVIVATVTVAGVAETIGLLAEAALGDVVLYGGASETGPNSPGSSTPGILRGEPSRDFGLVIVPDIDKAFDAEDITRLLAHANALTGPQRGEDRGQ